MGVDLATYMARIGCFVSRRNVSCDDEKRIITSMKEKLRVRNVSKAPSTTNLKSTTIKVSSSSHTDGGIEFDTLLRKSPQGRLTVHLCPQSAAVDFNQSPKSPHSPRAVAMFTLTLLVSYLLINQLLILSGNVELNPGPLGQHTEGESGSSQPLLKDLVCLRVPPTKWYQLGLQLNISEHQLDVIKANNAGNIETCILEMFKAWLSNTAGASYAELGSALNRIGEHSVAAHVLHSSSATMHQATRAGSGFQGPPLPIQPSGGCTPNGSASNRIGQQQQPVDQTDGVPYREQISAMDQPSNEHRPSGATNGNGQQQQQIHLDQNETPAFSDDDFSNQVAQNLLRTDVAKRSDDQFIERYCKEVEIVLQAANKYELVAILSKLEPPTKMVKLQTFRKDFVGKKLAGNYHLGIFGGYKAALVQTEQGGKCQQLITETFKQFPNLSLIIGAGIAYARDKHTIKVGDVLVSSLIAMLDTVKYQPNGQITGKNCETIRVRGKLHTVFCENSHEFNTFACTKGASTTRYSKVHVGTIISAPFLVNNEEIKDRLWENAVEAIGGEMEGHVLMEIMQQQNPCTFEIIIIKGVSDYGDGTKNDKWQFTAALAAVEYTHYQLMRTNGTLFPETTQTNGPALRVVGEGTAAMVQPYIELPSSGALSGQQPQLDCGQFGPPIQPSGGHPPKGSVSNTIGQQQQPMDCTDGVPYHEQLSLLNMECSEEDLLTIAGYDFRWKRVGRRLLCDQKVNDIDREESGEGDRREKMLLEWKKTKTHDATYQALVKVLRDMGNNATADRVEKLRGRGN